MKKLFSNRDRVSVCHKDNCIHANGKNADLIAWGAFLMLLLFGIAALARSK